MEEVRRELEQRSSNNNNDEVLRWSDEELATNLQLELLDILRKRDAHREE